MERINHPEAYKSGVRVFMLAGRYKDHVACKRTVLRVSRSSEHFERVYNDLVSIAEVGERIYVSAGARSLEVASRIFKQRMLDNDYVPEPMDFFQDLSNRWISCLMQREAEIKGDRFWLFDCDEAGEANGLREELTRLGDVGPQHVYSYMTKSGEHVMTTRFNKMLLSDQHRSNLKDNPMMLWGF